MCVYFYTQKPLKVCAKVDFDKINAEIWLVKAGGIHVYLGYHLVKLLLGAWGQDCTLGDKLSIVHERYA